MGTQIFGKGRGETKRSTEVRGKGGSRKEGEESEEKGGKEEEEGKEEFLLLSTGS